MTDLIDKPTQRKTSVSRFVIGTRGSALALWQANAVRDLLVERYPELTFDLHVIRPEGDIDKTSSLLKIGGRGVFASALQEALLSGEIDIAVHSTKDVPTIEPAGLVIAAFPAREDARDAVVSLHGVGLAQLPASPVIGTSSRRRAVQVQDLRPDATIIDLRGNIDTRLRKAESGDYDAVILAAAGLTRMGWQDRITEYLPFDQFVPSPGQGALAIETRTDPDPAHAIAESLDKKDVAHAVRLEREFLRAMGGGCATPIGAHAEIIGESVHIWAMISSDDGTALSRASDDIPLSIAESMIPTLAARMVNEIRQHWNGPDVVPAILASDRPLHGKQALVTGTSGLTHKLDLAFQNEGARVVKSPTLDILPTSTPVALQAELERVEDLHYQWVVITSQQTIPALSSFGPERIGPKVRIATVGTSTADELREIGLDVDLVPAIQTGEGLVEAFAGIGLIGDRVLCLLGNTAGDTVTDGLAALGAIVTRVESYQSRTIDHIDDDARRAVRAGRIDLAVFSSPLSVQALTSQLGADLGALSGACLVAIGTTTRSAMDRAGLPVHVVAAEPTPEGVVAASRAYFQNRLGLEAFSND